MATVLIRDVRKAFGTTHVIHGVDISIADGEFVRAAELLGPAAATLERTGYSWGPLSLTLLATALAQQQAAAAAAKALSRAESRHGPKSAMFAPEPPPCMVTVAGVSLPLASGSAA